MEYIYEYARDSITPEKMIKVEFEISERTAEGIIKSTRTLGLVYYKDYEVLIASISKALADSK